MAETNIPHLVTALPGPRAQAIVARSEQAITPSLPRAYPLAVKRAQGVVIEDVDGNLLLDCAAGIAVCATGHCHPAVVQAIHEQSSRLIHICSADFYDSQYTELAERLVQLAPGSVPKKVFLGNSGAEAVEAALKLARHHTGRTQIVAFSGAFHGRTMGAVSLSASSPRYKEGFRPLVPGITHVPYAYCYRCSYNLAYPACGLACVVSIEEETFAHSVAPEEVAAVFVEPVLGEGGYVVPPPGWLEKLRALCDKYGILLVADEIQSGLGRTGKMWAVEHSDVVPDILCSAKALASGMPVSAMIARSEVMSWRPGAHGSTFGGNPVCCAAAQATLDVIEQEGLLENATRVGQRLLDNLRELAEESHLIGDVRGLGLMVGVELVLDKEAKLRANEKAREVVQECFKRGLLLLTCGPNNVRFSPPLTITEGEAGTAFQIFADALAQVEHRA
jgi:4-aminobutyrate aminotransferase